MGKIDSLIITGTKDICSQRYYAAPVEGRINCCTPSVRPSVRPSRASDLLEIGKPQKPSNLVET